MDFDPKAYLAQKKTVSPAGGQAEGFDPAAYLQAKAGTSVSSLANMPKTIQEMHPEFTVADRFVVKNLATNNEAAVNYLQKRHPNLEISVDDLSGQIKARDRSGKEGNTYRVLDPDTDMASTGSIFGDIKRGVGEAAMDIGDIGYDVVSGLGTGAATAAAGLAGGAASVGIGALPSAALAGAGSSAGFEGLKQALGRAVGIEGNFDLPSVGIAGAAGAISPLVFGTGGQVASSIGKKVLGENLDDAALAGIQSVQRGLVGRGADKFVKPALTKLGSTLSGIGEEAISTYGNKKDVIQAMEKNPQAVRDFATETGQETKQILGRAKEDTWSIYQKALDAASDSPVDISTAKKKLEETVLKSELNAVRTKNVESQGVAEELRAAFNRLFADAEGNAIPDQLPASAASELERSLADMAEFSAIKPSAVKGGVGGRLQGLTRAEKSLAIAAAGAKKELNKSLESVLPSEALAARAKYGEIANLEKELTPMLETPSKIMKTFRNLSKPANQSNLELMHGIDKSYGTDLVGKSKIAEAYTVFHKPGALPLSSKGMSGLGRMGAAAGLGSAVGYGLGGLGEGNDRYAGAAIGGLTGGFLGSPAMLRRYIDLGLKGGKLNQSLGPIRPGLGSQVLQSPWTGIDNK